MARENMVEPDRPPKRPFHEGAEEIAVARRQARAAGIDEGRRVRPLALDAQENAEGERPN
jgi:hypothetical protein